MKKNLLLIISVIFAFSSCSAQPQGTSLTFQGTIPLPGVSGRIDHFAFDPKNEIVFVAALGNNSIEVVDLKSKKVIHSIKNLNEPQGVVFIPESNSIFVANGDNGECDVFSAITFQKINSIFLGDDADNVRYDTEEKKIYVGYGSGGIAIIDAVSFRIISEIKFTGHPEAFQIEKAGKKIFANVPDVKGITVIDATQKKVIEQWKIKEASSNFPMALDEANHRLFIGCRHAPKLLVINSQTGKTIYELDIDHDVDDIFYNTASKEIYLSCGDGYIDIVKQTNADTYSMKEKIETHSGARTSLFIPELKQFIVASPSSLNREAQLLIYTSK